MKHTLLTAITLFLACTAVQLHAQLSVGGHIGINISSISVDPEPDDENYSSKVGFSIGGVLTYDFSENLSFRTEPMFMQKGAHAEDDIVEIDFNLAYFELPLLITYNISTDGNIAPYIMAGPQIGFLLSAKYEDDAGNEFDVKDDTAGIDFSIGVGGGVNIPMDSFNLFGQLRYVLGLTNVNEEAGSDEATVNNRGLHIQFGAVLPLD